MIKKYIFIKKKSYIFFKITLITLFTLIVFFIFNYYYNKKLEIIIFENNEKKFYIIPIDKKGKNIPNTEIKILDYDYNLNETNNRNYSKINFSIQLYSSSNYDSVAKIYNKYMFNSSFQNEDLFIVSLKHNLGIDYLLVYKDFVSRDIALNYCTNYLNFIDNCLIVNIQNLD